MPYLNHDCARASIVISGSILSEDHMATFVDAIMSDNPLGQISDPLDMSSDMTGDDGWSEDVVRELIAKHAASGEPLTLEDPSMPRGAFKAIEKACQTIGLAFLRSTASSGDIHAQTVVFDPAAGLVETYAGSDYEHGPYLPTSEALSLVEAGQTNEIRRRLQKLANLDADLPRSIAVHERLEPSHPGT